MASTSKYDVIILGGGPAGMSAALWCSDLGLKALLMEKGAELGGQLLQIFAPIKNYPGVETRNGIELRDRFLRSLSNLSCEVRLGSKVRTVDLANKSVEFENGNAVSANALIIATGVRRRKLGVEGEEDFVGRGILTSGTKEQALVKDASVVIVGGGDAALENALILSAYASKVTVVHRRNDFSARPEFVNAAAARSNVEFLMFNTVNSFSGDDRLTRVVVRSLDGSVSTIDASYALVRIGVEPNSELFRDQVDLDPAGFVEIAKNCQTSVEGVYAVGDVAFPVAPTISTAVGTAAAACKHIALNCEKLQKTSKT